MFNPETKTAFLQGYKENTQKAYSRVFNLTMKFEVEKDKDLLHFTLDEIETALYSFHASTGDSLNTAGRTISAYLNWARAEGLREDTNPLESVSKEWFKNMVGNTHQQFITKQEIDAIIDQCNNDQDSVILSLLFEGAGGREVSELRNLKREQVNDEKRTLILINDKEETREIQISEQCLKLINGAIKQKEYLKGNGEMRRDHLKETSELIETGYVIRPAKTRNVHMEQVSPHLIYGRLHALEEYFGLDNLRVKTIQRSGMIWMGKQLLERDGELGKEQYYEICERFGVSKVMNGNKLEYLWWGLKDFVNPDMIAALYE
ncbi:hypothetical protein BRE01_22180 [Brevibacillus reuszeri]|uniref:Core-binding (CB) domain-containing protein n=1 Tax=Brevibacillus reuszeri TaxID=54915 RepID=A0A0K9YWS7_9BACL|nr:site-specific integrase [Brevibacillus reuszeri]KNB73143.1 hypothetical protein ADS79_03980 [Brevibacillus reuszeri]MED1856737.1 site-specific integrase [Brevibacillus reuszeri]GED68516.1 hypothetical protein BRE01_22180 [Brevibacillus reuszeri]